jgi:FtsP/CotA-like multicopper oxidase with cupredoxin domain
VEERDPPAVNRDVPWVLGDWRLTRDAQIAGGFANAMEAGMAGRIGNTVTVPESFAVQAGERVRLRLINAANARIFGLQFEGHAPKVIALDGHPVEPHGPKDGRIVLAPAQRIDLILDFTGEPGRRFRIVDSFYKRLEYRLLDLVYSDEPPLRASNEAFIGLPGNPVPEPDLHRAERHEIVFGGGMMSMMSSAVMERARGRHAGHDEPRYGLERQRRRVDRHVHQPALTLSRGRSYVLALRNDSAWWHPIHLHGHTFRVIGAGTESGRGTANGRTPCSSPRRSARTLPSSPTTRASG